MISYDSHSVTASDLNLYFPVSLRRSSSAMNRSMSVERASDTTTRSRNWSAAFDDLHIRGRSQARSHLPESCVQRWGAELLVAISELHETGLLLRYGNRMWEWGWVVFGGCGMGVGLLEILTKLVLVSGRIVGCLLYLIVKHPWMLAPEEGNEKPLPHYSHPSATMADHREPDFDRVTHHYY